jgi:adenylate cyclase 8
MLLFWIFSVYQELERCGFRVEQRGMVPVKGKGEMETYFVLGREEMPKAGLARTPTAPSSLAAVVYGLVQAKRRHTIKRPGQFAAFYFN